MNEIILNSDGSTFTPSDDGVETRIFRVMIAAVALGVGFAAWLAPWRFTTGLLLGGLLSFLNYHWMRSSVAALIQARAQSAEPGNARWKYAGRYFVTVGVVVVAYVLNIASLPAMIIGLSSFVIGLFAEAFRQFYFTIIHREDTN